MVRKYIAILLLILSVCSAQARVGKLRMTFRDNTSTTAVIGWTQQSGSAPVFYFGESDAGNDLNKYPITQQPQRKVDVRGMSTCFVRLSKLKPNTTYFFQIKDSEGQMPLRLCFRTLPNGPNQPLSIIAGGDSRNNRIARQSANRMVAKLKPHVVLFNGDFTESDTDEEWQTWLDDWQLTTTKEGLLIPILVARGNHEENNEVLEQLFDVPSPKLYYALTLGADLLRVYTLNSMLPTGGEQAAWLANDLRTSQNCNWRMAQFHFAMRPHTAGKEEKLEQYKNWASLFYENKVQLCLESDSHVAKTTWPLKPSVGAGSAEGFVRDDENGTTYVGEGCWGAPLRRNDDDKPWTRASGSFNHFDWIWVDQKRMDIRVVKTDNAASVSELTLANPFAMPTGIDIWNQNNQGSTITLKLNKGAPSVEDETPEPVANTSTSTLQVSQCSVTGAGTDLSVRWQTSNEQKACVFELQRSIDGDPYTTVAQVNGKLTPKASYAVLDKACLSSYTGKYIAYRIKYVPANGTATFHELPSDDPGAASTNTVSVNIAAGEQITAKYKLTAPGDVNISLFTDGVRRVKHLELKTQSPGLFSKQLDPAELPRGLYFLIVRQGKTILLRQKILLE